MTGHKCCVCGNTKAKEPGLSFHRIPKEPSRRAVWLQVFMLTEEDMKPSTRVCSRHFPDGDASKIPNVNPGISSGVSVISAILLFILQLFCVLNFLVSL